MAKACIPIVEDEGLSAFRQILENVRLVALRLDAQGRIIYCNAFLLELTGWGREDVLGQNWFDLFMPGDSGIQQALLDAGLAGRLPAHYENDVHTRSGERRRIAWNNTALCDERGQVTGAACLGEDITERRRAEETLKCYQLLAENSRDIILFIRRHDGRIVEANRAALSAYGYTLDELLSMTLYDLRAPVTRPLTPIQMETADASGVWVETLHRRKDGSTFPVEVNAHGAVVGEDRLLLSIFRDITERRQAEAELHLKSTALEAAANGIMIADRHGTIRWINPAFTALTGYTAEQAIGQNPAILGSPHQDTATYAELWETILAGRVWRGELINRRSDGSLYVEEQTVTPLRDERGSITHFIAIKQDITARKQRERELEAIAAVSAALRAARTRADMLPVVVSFARSLLSADGVALTLCDPTRGVSVVALARGAWENCTGTRLAPGAGVAGRIIATGRPYRSDDVRSDLGLTPDDLAGDVFAVVGVPLIADHEIIGALVAGRRGNGGTQTQPILSDADLRLLMTIGDIAAIALYRAGVLETLAQRVAERTRELAAANERLQDLDRLKSKFVSDVSHELRAPVTNLNLYLNLLERGHLGKRDQYMTVLQEQAARLTQLIEDILDLTRLDRDKPTFAFAPVDVNTLVQQVVTAHQPRAESAGFSLTFDPAPDVPAVHGARNSLAQVVTNLVTNAINYTPAGSVQVRTRANGAPHAVCLEVQDTGIGIDPEDVAHVFERFYRGKRAGQMDIPGTGLGLGIVKEIVDLHGGRIEVESRVGAGSTFRVWLPVAPAAPPGS